MARRVTFLEGVTTQNIVLSSKYFDLIAQSSTGMGNVPWSGYKVQSKDEAEDLVVRINLDQDMWDIATWYEGKPPVVAQYTGSNIVWGFQSHGHPDPKMMIIVLKDAIKFKQQVDEFLRKEGHTMTDKPFGRPNGIRTIK